MTRDEHLTWCKERALEYLKINDYDNAINSMASDLQKHEAWSGGSSVAFLTMGAHMGIKDRFTITKWINGFN